MSKFYKILKIVVANLGIDLPIILVNGSYNLVHLVLVIVSGVFPIAVLIAFSYKMMMMVLMLESVFLT